VIKAKIRAFARMNYMTKILRDNAETVVKIKEHSQGGKLELGSILAGSAALQRQHMNFHNANQRNNSFECFPHNSPRHSMSTR